jgi:glycosyltransferase involved in cell wall biosynthesis
MVSAIILTKNEERDLPGCLDSLSWCDDIHICDSGSTDQTLEIARRYQTTLSIHPFQSFGDQRNWSIDHCPIKYDWILFLDADERATPAFQETLLDAIQNAGSECAGFFCCWKMMLGETWLKRSDNFPKWQFRVLRKGRARFIDVGHGQKEGPVQGRIEYLREPYLHFPFRAGWHAWEERHKRYAKLEANERTKSPLRFMQIFSKHASKRNPAIKQFFATLPGWPYFRFFYSYFVKGGWIDGRASLEYCRRIFWYEMLIKSELRSFKKAQTSTKM